MKFFYFMQGLAYYFKRSIYLNNLNCSINHTHLLILIITNKYNWQIKNILFLRQLKSHFLSFTDIIACFRIKNAFVWIILFFLNIKLNYDAIIQSQNNKKQYYNKNRFKVFP